MTTNVFVISEYTSPDRQKQVILERVRNGIPYYRVTSIVRCASMDAVKNEYMSSIPASHRARAVEDINSYVKDRKRGNLSPAEAQIKPEPEAKPIPKKKRGRPSNGKAIK